MLTRMLAGLAFLWLLAVSCVGASYLTAHRSHDVSNHNHRQLRTRANPFSSAPPKPPGKAHMGNHVVTGYVDIPGEGKVALNNAYEPMDRHKLVIDEEFHKLPSLSGPTSGKILEIALDKKLYLEKCVSDKIGALSNLPHTPAAAEEARKHIKSDEELLRQIKEYTDKVYNDRETQLSFAPGSDREPRKYPVPGSAFDYARIRQRTKRYHLERIRKQPPPKAPPIKPVQEEQYPKPRPVQPVQRIETKVEEEQRKLQTLPITPVQEKPGQKNEQPKLEPALAIPDLELPPPALPVAVSLPPRPRLPPSWPVPQRPTRPFRPKPLQRAQPLVQIQTQQTQEEKPSRVKSWFKSLHSRNE